MAIAGHTADVAGHEPPMVADLPEVISQVNGELEKTMRRAWHAVKQIADERNIGTAEAAPAPHGRGGSVRSVRCCDRPFRRRSDLLAFCRA